MNSDEVSTIGFGNELRRARSGLRMTQRELGDAIGVTPKTICLWEQGSQQPGVRILSRLFDALKFGDVRRLLLIELLGVRGR